jgi:hypothetical protein
MLEAIIEFAWEFIIESVLAILWWLVLFPVVWVVCVPFILLFAAVCQEPYYEAVANMFNSVTCFWRDNGLSLIS